MSAEISDRVTVGVAPAEVFKAVSDVSRMAGWSPECIGTWVWLRRDGLPARFVGFNRRGAFLWFTSCQVVTARPGEEFAFEVTAFGLPLARWSYQFAAVTDGTEVTETWTDRRERAARVLGRIFTGKMAVERPQINREGIRSTLDRLKQELEAAA
jgi:hypothetical protein